jgi:phosphatidylserine/phosphatidylglycerophosphate/cardiolipin synthase-like enzyme
MKPARRPANPLAALALATAALLAVAAGTPAGAVPIRDLHVNTTSGVPAPPYGPGVTVTVTGVVVSPDNTFSLTNDEVVVRDTSGAITVFRAPGAFVYNLGDSVTVTGQIAHFNGLTEISNASIVTFHSAGNLAFYNDPIVLTCKQVRDSTFNFDTIREDRESQLIRINNVTVTGGTWPTTCTGVNSTLTISDATGSTTLFIDRDTGVCGSSNPSGPFDVIGILTQFDSTAPYIDGYQIKPRFASDIIPLTPGPNFVGVPTAVATDSTTASVSWLTDVASTSIVQYGLTPALGAVAGDSTATASHQVTLTGLIPNRLYYYRVVSCDGAGCRQSAQFSFVTPSSTPGQMNFYFNRSVDISLANPDTANGNVDLRQRLIAYINRATFSIDCAFYSFNDPPVTDALIARWNAGVKVRLILDAENSQAQADRLRVIGVPVITSTFGGNHATGIHHNKFVLVDARDASTGNDWTWSGSTNCSTDQLLLDPNNAFEIQDYGLTQAFLIEFNEQWGSGTDAPNAATARMGSGKTDNTPHFFTVNGIPVEVWFSPSDGTDGKIAQYVGTADYGVAYSILAFTSDPIADAMRARYQSIPGFYVRGVHEAGQASGSGSEYPEMKGIGGGDPWSPPADVWTDAESGLHHHKYLIIDEGRTASDPILISGSHNWSAAANTVNDENTVVFHSQRIANLFQQEFRARYTAAGGAASFTVDAGAAAGGGFAFAAPRPNPSAGGRGTTFALTVPPGAGAGARVKVDLYSVTGRRVRALLDAPAVSGPLAVTWDGADDAGRAVAPGVYLARATLGAERLDRKVVRIP